MNYSRRETLELSATALAALSVGAVASAAPAAAQGTPAAPQPDALVERASSSAPMVADSGDYGQAFRLIADTDSNRSRTAFR